MSMTIAIFGNCHQKEDAVRHIGELIETLCAHGVDVDIESGFSKYLTAQAGYDITGRCSTFAGGEPLRADMAISLGGDGTMLRTVQATAPFGVPVVGFNSGHLGFLAAAPASQASAMVEQLLTGDYTIEDRAMLSICCVSGQLHVKHPYALNEIVVTRTDVSTMIEIGVSLDGVPLSTFTGDGLIVSTPTGSTAYNLSVGGPILEPMSRCLALSPISPHSLNVRPVVVGDNKHITVTARSRASQCQVNIDGETTRVPSGTVLEIVRAPFSTRLIMPKSRSFAMTLRSKLLWGNDNR